MTVGAGFEPINPPSVVQIRQLTLGYGAKVLLRDLSFDLPERGLVALLGPSGVGKSTLLRALARQNDAQPSFWARGQILLDGRDLLQQDALEVQRRVALLPQKARLYTASVLDNILLTLNSATSAEARIALARDVLQPWGLWREFAPLLQQPVLDLSIAAHKKILLARLLADPAVRCLLVDEPLREVAVAEEDSLSELLQRIAERLPVVLVTHSKPEARRLSRQVCFITGDRLVEMTPSEEFFRRPRSELGRAFLDSGSSWPRAVAEEAAPTPVPTAALAPPREFHWVLMNKLGGMPKPGLWGDVDGDLRGLRALGVDVLVSLTETPFDAAKLTEFAIRGVHFPIVDMAVPTPADAAALCIRLDTWIDNGRVVVLHCKAGLGRTGTLLACALVYRGMAAERAIETVRTIQPGYIQSDCQLAFVGEFEAYLSQHDADAMA